MVAAPGAVLGGSSHSINAEETTCAEETLVADPCPAPTTHRDRVGSKSAPTTATNRCDPVVDAPRGDAERADPNPTPECISNDPTASSTTTPAYACDAVPYDVPPNPSPGARRSGRTDPGDPAGDTHVAVASVAPAPGSTAATTDVVPNRHEWRDPKPNPKPKPDPPLDPIHRAATTAPPRHAPAVPFHLNSDAGDRHDANALDASDDDDESCSCTDADMSILATATRCNPGSSAGVSHVKSADETNRDSCEPKTSLWVTFIRASVANQVHADAGANPPSAVACVTTPPPASEPVGRMDAIRPGTTYSKTSVSLPP